MSPRDASQLERHGNRGPARWLPAFTAALAACVHSPAAPGADLVEPVARAEAVQRCVRADFQASQLLYTGTVESFVVEDIDRNFERFTAAAPEVFCKELIARYPKGRALPGNDDIESDREIIAFVQNHTWGHVLGHSDITGLVCLDATLGWALDGDACKLLRSASQSPDFFHWYEDAYHAQTREDLPGSQAERESASSAQFLEHLQRHLDAARDAKRRGEDGRAIFELGLGLHGVQDLVFHQGLTLRQHAGLSFYLGKNPDKPPGDGEDGRIREAARVSARLLRHFERTRGVFLGELAGWSKPAGFQYLANAKAWTGAKEDISVTGLVKYWALSLPYRFGTRADDLSEGKRARWDVEQVLMRILAEQPPVASAPPPGRADTARR